MLPCSNFDQVFAPFFLSYVDPYKGDHHIFTRNSSGDEIANVNFRVGDFLLVLIEFVR